MPGPFHVTFGVASTDPSAQSIAPHKKPSNTRRSRADPHRFPPFYGNRSDFSLNFILLLRVVITSSVAERRKQLLKQSDEIQASQICHNKYIFNNNKKTLQVKNEK